MCSSPNAPAAEASPVKSFWSSDSYWLVGSDTDSFVEVTHDLCGACRSAPLPCPASGHLPSLVESLAGSPLDPVSPARRVWRGDADETLSPLPSTGSVSSVDGDEELTEPETLIPLVLSPVAPEALGPPVDRDRDVVHARTWPGTGSSIPSPRRRAVLLRSFPVEYR
eukprot:Hpha_TRINITY_DN15287_c1_g8::TRINITY_DN15287_c1_g8_i1::g.67976::m.67976